MEYLLISDKEGYSKIEGADFDYQSSHSFKRYGLGNPDDVIVKPAKPRGNSSSSSSLNSGHSESNRLLGDGSKSKAVVEDYSRKDSQENTWKNLPSKLDEYPKPITRAKSTLEKSTSSLETSQSDFQTGASQLTEKDENTSQLSDQSAAQGAAGVHQSKKIKPIRVKAHVPSLSSGDDEEKTQMDDVVKQLGAEQYTYIKRNGRKVVVIKDRGGTSFLFLGKNKHKV